MKASQRRNVLIAVFAAGAAAATWAYTSSLVPATHPDHDHGILNLDAGGKLLVATRDGKSRNLVGRPGKVLVVHFFSTKVDDAAPELANLFEVEKKSGDADFVLIAKDPSFEAVDAWLKEKKLDPPSPSAITLDPEGETTQKLNCKRPLETMFFTAEGKLSGQARGRLDWQADGAALLERARTGTTLE